ncbi:hypothetical protein OAU24_00400 [bacterium]|jgi:hypothetical protein|nr:hypothetical protein [bacterium]
MANNLTFIINLYIPHTLNGGLMVLHKLAYELANRGHNVYIFTKPVYPHVNIKIIPSIRKNENFINNNSLSYKFTLPNLDFSKTISIYPEGQIGNPYNTKYVTRWILYHTKNNIENTWGENDVYFKYMDSFTTKKSPIGKLNIGDYNFDKLYDEDKKREGFCYILHKNTPQNSEELLKLFNATNLTGWQKKGYDYLRKELNKYEYLLLFDHKTFNSTAALLCGTKVINLFPNPPIPPEQYREENPLQKFGLAQGLSDITYANETIHLARPHIKESTKEEGKSVDDFIKYWIKNIN